MDMNKLEKVLKVGKALFQVIDGIFTVAKTLLEKKGQ